MRLFKNATQNFGRVRTIFRYNQKWLTRSVKNRKCAIRLKGNTGKMQALNFSLINLFTLSPGLTHFWKVLGDPYILGIQPILYFRFYRKVVFFKVLTIGRVRLTFVSTQCWATCLALQLLVTLQNLQIWYFAALL